MRTFIGISLSEETKESLHRICIGLEGIRWLDPENFHLTLAFLGELDPDRIEIVSEICSEIRSEPFRIDIKGVGIFGHKSPEVLYTSVIASEELKNLQKSLDSSLRRAGFSLEKKEYKPHITIGRFRKTQEKKLNQYLQEFETFELPGIQVSEFHIFSSRTGPEGAMYRVEETYPLSIE
ncbi:RNA 2',3'-cyclic phosphodiesterase [Leptospira wolffii]|uniref:RNA 2',3'-cyclic phosphodiesterase n=1 Tax=Leptospira wolffii TaxID=409998 RepID=A0A2M9ZF53_9LEPT|nr:RNA 2',3'-cyclic phosphodiesterase [Leptospira wolffii]PJZ67033.1 RNA 2',3'-cyclic phosphodiesterase [Leptospira wolffii]